MQRFWIDIGTTRWRRYNEAGIAKYLPVCAQFDTSIGVAMDGDCLADQAARIGRIVESQYLATVFAR